MKVVILGGGPAGCAAAYMLKNRGVSDVTVVERDRLGGCSYTQHYEGIPYEFGPQIMYTDEDRLRAVFEKWLVQTPPPTDDREYHPAVSIDGTLDDPHDFPITIRNVMKLPDPGKVIYELYKLNLDQPDFSNFENYIVSRMGPTLYETYVKNYNIKQWKIHPRDMDAEWARFRTLTLREKPDMFRGRWQGHPGDYNPMWKGLTADVRVTSGLADVSEDFQRVTVDGSPVEADLVVSTLPLSKQLGFINTTIVFVAVKAEGKVMPSYATSFPNNYGFVRVMDFKQQYHVDSPLALLDFEFPWVGECEERKYVEEAVWFVKHVLRREIVDQWVWTKPNIYPVSTRTHLELANHQLELAAASKVVPLGRLGVHAYCSKDTCIRMAMTLADHLETVTGGDVGAKRSVLAKLREKLS